MEKNPQDTMIFYFRVKILSIALTLGDTFHVFIDHD